MKCSSRLLFTVMLMLLAGSPQQVISGDDIPEIRLSGTFISTTESHAFIEYRDGKISLVKPGEMIDSWGLVTEIQQSKIILRDSDNVLYEVMTEGVRTISSPMQMQQQVSSIESTKPINKIKQPKQQKEPYGKATTTAELMTEIYQLTRQDDSVGDDINGKVAQILKLSPNARIVEIDFEPLSKDNSSLLKLEQSLAQGSVVRLIIQGDPEIKWVYLTPDPDL